MFSRFGNILLIALSVALLGPPDAQAAQVDRGPVSVLIIHSYHPGFTWTDNIMKGIDEGLEAVSPASELHVEYMDAKRFGNAEVRTRFIALLKAKTRGMDYPVIITTDNIALQMVLDVRPKMFPRSQIVFCGLNGPPEDVIRGRGNVTGVTETWDPAGTLKAIDRLQPGVKEIVVLNDYTESGLGTRENLDAVRPAFEKRFSFRFLPPEPVENVLKELAGLPDTSAVLLMGYNTDSRGTIFDSAATGPLFAGHARVPVYTMDQTRFSGGVVGGSLLSGERQGELAAAMAVRILGGESTEAIPIIREPVAVLTFDYMALKRFGLKIEDLPPESIIINQPTSFYHHYRYHIWALTAVIVILSLLAIGLVLMLLSRRRLDAERIRALDALRGSEARYTTLVNAMPDVIVHLDLEGRIMFVNEHTLRISGYSRDDLVGQEMLRFVAPEDRTKAVEYSLLMLEKRLGPQQYHLIVKDGRKIPFEVNGDVLRGADGQPFGIVHVCRDISERKRSEESIRESEEKFARIFRMSPDTLIISRLRDGVYIDVNDEFIRKMGYTSEDAIGKTASELGMWVDMAERDHMMNLLLKKGGIQEEKFSFRSKDGSIKTGEMSARIISIGGEPCFIAMIRDITEKIETQRALKESEEKFRSVVERSLVGIALIDDTLRYTYVNEEFCRIAGYSEAEMLGRNFTFPLTEESAQMVTERFQRRQRGEDVPSQYEFFFQQKNGSRHIGEVRSAVYVDSSGKAKTAIQVIDITDRKQTEEEKRRLEERLNRAEKMEALGTLAGGVAHDLNNVLGVVIGNAELLLRGVGKADPTRPRLLNIMKGGERAAAIVLDLLTLARRGVIGRDVLNLSKVAEDFRSSPELERLLSYHASVRIITELDPELLNISGSSVHLLKTLFNLVSNACEAMPDGGLLTIKTANQYLDQPLQGYDEVREGDYVVLSVSDTGQGIAAEDLNHIFEPFYTKKVMGRSGTGLGLAVVWGTVKDHNGYINVQSEEGRGSTFILYFPVTRQAPGIAVASPSLHEYMGRGEFILVVDDVKEQRELAAEMLKGLLYRVETVTSGEEALSYLKDHTADLMILDMIMDPGMDGLETYRRVLEIRPKQKAIIVSGFSDTDRVKKAQTLGAGEYVRKPYIIEKLGLAVRKELDRSDW
ncbi:MAG: PAS domain S-box protein [Syntrophaceae bacterium]